MSLQKCCVTFIEQSKLENFGFAVQFLKNEELKSGMLIEGKKSQIYFMIYVQKVG